MHSRLLLLLLPACAIAQTATLAPIPIDARLATLEAAAKSAHSAGDNAWMLTSSALVLMMTGPGLALFYGGLVRRKNVLATMMQSFAGVRIRRFAGCLRGARHRRHAGALLTGVFATNAVNDSFKDSTGKLLSLGLVDGHPGQVLNQAIGAPLPGGLRLWGHSSF